MCWTKDFFYKCWVELLQALGKSAKWTECVNGTDKELKKDPEADGDD
jgi:hypothetical protein